MNVTQYLDRTSRRAMERDRRTNDLIPPRSNPDVRMPLSAAAIADEVRRHVWAHRRGLHCGRRRCRRAAA